VGIGPRDHLPPSRQRRQQRAIRALHSVRINLLRHPVKKRELAGGYRLVAHLTRTTSSAAYVVNRRAAETLLKSMRPITEQVDHALDRPWETGLRTRGIRPMPVVLAPVAHTTSTIGYQDKKKVRPLGKAVKLFLSRAKKEISRFGYGLWDVVR